MKGKETMLQALERISNDDKEESRRLQALHRENGGDPMSHPHAAEVDFVRLYEHTELHDDVKGGLLPKQLVIEGRKLEMDYFKRMGVYTKVSRAEAEGSKIIDTKWVDTNNGSVESPDVRCRLVGKEFNDGVRPDLFAATPPLESLKHVISRCASTQGRRKPHRLLSVDVKRAYFCAKA